MKKYALIVWICAGGWLALFAADDDATKRSDRMLKNIKQAHTTIPVMEDVLSCQPNPPSPPLWASAAVPAAKQKIFSLFSHLQGDDVALDCTFVNPLTDLPWLFELTNPQNTADDICSCSYLQSVTQALNENGETVFILQHYWGCEAPPPGDGSSIYDCNGQIICDGFSPCNHVCTNEQLIWTNPHNVLDMPWLQPFVNQNCYTIYQIQYFGGMTTEYAFGIEKCNLDDAMPMVDIYNCGGNLLCTVNYSDWTNDSLCLGLPNFQQDFQPEVIHTCSSFDCPDCICPDVVAPVCANGVTYGNACEAECLGIYNYTAGACGGVSNDTTYIYATLCQNPASVYSDLLGSFGDEEGVGLSVAPQHGLVTFTGQPWLQSFSYVPNAGFTGKDEFVFTAGGIQIGSNGNTEYTIYIRKYIIEIMPCGGGCFDVSGVDFGSCAMALGIAWSGGQCTTLSGCDWEVNGVDYSSYFFQSIEACQNACNNPPNNCFDVSGVDFGDCEMLLGVAWSGGQCTTLGGCGWEVNGVDYSSYFFQSIEACQNACSTPPNNCFDVSGVDFGSCDMVLGIAWSGGQCTTLSGCDWEVNGVDYSSYFFQSIEACQNACSNPIDTGFCEAKIACDPIMPGSVLFISTSQSGSLIVSYTWTIDNNVVSNEMQFTYEAEIGTTHSVCLTIATQGGCTDTFCDEFTVGEIAPPICTPVQYQNTLQNLINQADSDCCNIGSISTFQTPEGETVFFTQPNEANCMISDMPAVLYNCAGEQICMIGFMPSGEGVCPAELMASFTNQTLVWECGSTNPPNEQHYYIDVCVGSSIAIGLGGWEGNTSYTWSPVEGLSCTDCPNPVVTPTQDITYHLHTFTTIGMIESDFYYHLSIKNCSGCIDSTLIDPNAFCTLEYAPVCGCNGVTYSNACVAQTQGGVTSWSAGECQTVVSCDPANMDWLQVFMTEGTKITLHTYNGQQVYFVQPCTIFPDAMSVLYDCEGGFICGFGGIGGLNGEGCEGFVPANGLSVWNGCGGNDCPPPAQLMWLQTAIQNLNNGSDTCVCGIAQYQYNGEIVYLFDAKDECNAYDFPDVLYSCQGEMICITEGESNNSCVDFQGAIFLNNIWQCGSNPANCIDSTLINPSVMCIELYDPVCGCNGVTYSNECVAINYGGVTSWVSGECPNNGGCAPNQLGWLNELIQMLQMEMSPNCLGYEFIHQVGYQGQVGFLIDVNNASDAADLILDCSGNVICSMNGLTPPPYCSTYTILQTLWSCSGGSPECSADNCVWPGDANNDGFVNNYDVLSLGLSYNETGEARPNPSSVWIAQATAPWQSDINLVNAETAMALISYNEAYSDCNGDGIINSNDLSVIEQNYGLQVPSIIEDTPTVFDINGVADAPNNLNITFEDNQNIFQPGDTVTAYISLDNDTPNVGIQNVYGLAFTIQYDNEINGQQAIIASTVELTYQEPSWLSNNTELLKLNKKTGTTLQTAVVRINQQNVNGSGTIAKLRFVIDDNLAGKNAANIPIVIGIQQAAIVSKDGFVAPLQGTTTTAEVVLDVVDLELQDLHIYPVPADDYLNIQWKGNAQIHSIELVNILGQVVKNSINIESQQARLYVDNCQAGVYLLKINTEKGTLTRKVQIF